MKVTRAFAALLASLGAASALAQQAAAPYTYATRYNPSGQVTGTIAPDPDGAGALHFAATRNSYGTSGATTGLLIKVEQGELQSWPSELIAPSDWELQGYQFIVFVTKTISYDSYGRKQTESVIGADTVKESVTQLNYDVWERVKCRTVRMNKSAFGSLPSDACQLGTEGSFGPDRVTRFTYNMYGEVLTEERGVGTAVAQTYVTNQYETGSPLLRYQTDANGNKTELQYDERFRLKKRIYPSPTTPGSVNGADFNEYHYDNNGNVTYEQKRDGRSIINSYDANNRLTFKNLSDNTYSDDITYDYDLRGLTLSSCFGATDSCTTSGGGETVSYDGFGNVTSRTSRADGTTRVLTYQYDAEGDRTRITHPDNWYFKYHFDGLKRFDSLEESTTASPSATTTNLLTISYWPSGGRMDITRPSGAATNINFDPVLRLDSFTQNLAGTANDLTNAFDYNAANQIVLLSQSNTSYTFNQLGSRTGTYTPNGLNQYSSVAGQSLSYSATGNLTTDTGANMSYTYDMENRLCSTGGAVVSTLSYDVLGRLSQITVSGTTTQFHYDGDALVGEYVNNAMQRRYVHGDRTDEPLVQYNLSNVGTSYRRYLHADHQGSVIAQTDNAGNLLFKNAYDAFGVPLSTNTDRFGYTGQAWLKELGLGYYKARLYSPKIGRFLQTDPIFYNDDMNLYSYVGNDVVSRVDPTGLQGASCFSLESGIGSVCAGPALTVTQEDRTRAAQANLKVLDSRLAAKSDLNTPEEAAKAYCDLGGCAITAQSGFENGANIVPKGENGFGFADLRLGPEGGYMAIPFNFDAVADVHIHLVGASNGFSGGSIFSGGHRRDYAGDIETNVIRPTVGFVFRAGDGAGWSFNTTGYLKAIRDAQADATIDFRRFVKRIR